MEEPTSRDCKTPISNVYLTMIMQKVPRGKIPAITICPVMRVKHTFVRINQKSVIDPKKYTLASTRPLSDYYSEGQYKLFMEDGCWHMEFYDYEPFSRYIEYAGRNFDKYLKKFVR